MLFKHRRFAIQVLAFCTLIQSAQAQQQVGSLKLNPPATGKLAELIKRTRNNQNFDYNAMYALFNGPKSPYDLRVNMTLPAGQAVPICIDFVERYLNAGDAGKPMAQDYAFAAIYSAATLKKYGDKATPALPVLLRAVNNKRKWEILSDAAFEAFITIAPDDERAIPILIKRLNEDRTEKLQITTRELARRGSKARAAIPKLLKTMAPLDGWDKFDDDECLSYEALGAICREQFGLSVEDATQKLSSIASLPLEESAAVFATLIKAGTGAAPAVPALTELLKSKPQDHIRYVALLAIKASGHAADAEVLEAILHQNPNREELDIADHLASEVARAAVSPETPQALPVLVKLLTSSNLDERIMALTGLGMMKRTANPAIPAVVASLKQDMKAAKREGEGDYGRVGFYTSTLWQLGPGTPEVTNSIYEIMLPNSPYLTKDYGPSEFRNNWFMLLMAVGMPTEPKKRAFIESQILSALKGDPGPANAEDYGTAALTARKMKATPEKLVAPLGRILGAIDEKVWLSTDKSILIPYQMRSLRQGSETRTRQNPEIVFGYREVIQTLGSFGPKAKSAVPALRKLATMPMNASLWEVKPDAVAALKQIEGRS